MAVFRKLKHRWRNRISARSAPVVHRSAIKADWAEHRYYDLAEDEPWLATFWAEDSLFRRSFEKLDLTCVVEIGCGRGRHAAQIVGKCKRLFLVDINESNIAVCQARFVERGNVICLGTRGSDLAGIADGIATAVYSFDAMVHFEAADVISYLAETHRVLCPGGRALLHYSNYDQNPGGFYRDNPGHRNFFSECMMRHFADRAGLAVLEHAVFAWPPGSNGPATDACILLRR